MVVKQKHFAPNLFVDDGAQSRTLALNAGKFTDCAQPDDKPSSSRAYAVSTTYGVGETADLCSVLRQSDPYFTLVMLLPVKVQGTGQAECLPNVCARPYPCFLLDVSVFPTGGMIVPRWQLGITWITFCPISPERTQERNLESIRAASLSRERRGSGATCDVFGVSVALVRSTSKQSA